MKTLSFWTAVPRVPNSPTAPLLKKTKRNYKSKLTEQLVVEMRQAYNKGLFTNAEIAYLAGVAKGTAYSAICGISWGHVKAGLLILGR